MLLCQAGRLHGAGQASFMIAPSQTHAVNTFAWILWAARAPTRQCCTSVTSSNTSLHSLLTSKSMIRVYDGDVKGFVSSATHKLSAGQIRLPLYDRRPDLGPLSRSSPFLSVRFAQIGGIRLFPAMLWARLLSASYGRFLVDW